MRRHQLLSRLHEALQPRGYLEIGVSKGASLSLARCRTVGVDPAFEIVREINCDVQLVRAGSDEFFSRPEPLAHLPEGCFDLAFIDGMHLSEYALRDFINAERHARPGAVLLLDDMLPRSVAEASRDRNLARGRGGGWAGDVYKVADVLRRHRPDLTLVELDTAPTGTLAVLGLDPASKVLLEAYDEVVPELVRPDPQPVPEYVLSRSRAVDPEQWLASLGER